MTIKEFAVKYLTTDEPTKIKATPALFSWQSLIGLFSGATLGGLLESLLSHRFYLGKILAPGIGMVVGRLVFDLYTLRKRRRLLASKNESLAEG